MDTCVFIFGVLGSGVSHIGKRFSTHFQVDLVSLWEFYDHKNHILNADVVDCLRSKKEFVAEMASPPQQIISIVESFPTAIVCFIDCPDECLVKRLPFLRLDETFAIYSLSYDPPEEKSFDFLSFDIPFAFPDPLPFSVGLEDYTIEDSEEWKVEIEQPRSLVKSFQDTLGEKFSLFESSEATSHVYSRIKSFLTSFGIKKGIHHTPVRLQFFDSVLLLQLESRESNPSLVLPEDVSIPQEIEVLNPETNTFVSIPATLVKRGDICRFNAGQRSPADLILLDSSSPLEIPIQMDAMDGDKDLILRQIVSLPELQAQLIKSLGNGDTQVPTCLFESMQFEMRQPSFVFPTSVGFAITQDAKIKLKYRQILPYSARLVFVDYVLGIVLFTGYDTTYSMAGGFRGFLSRNALRLEQKEKEKLQKKQREEEQRGKLLERVDASILEAETSISWKDSFTNVPDDGNCMMHAVWLGLKELFEKYPHLEESFPNSPEEFREESLAPCDSEYRSCLESQIQLWIQLDPVMLLSEVEDFYTLPEDLQSSILQINQLVQAGEVEDVSLLDLVDNYIDALRVPREINGRITYQPLGELEIDALVRVWNVCLQIMKNDTLKLDENQQIDTIDPRTIPNHLIFEKGKNHKPRIVRILNVNTNHYMVHLPISPR